jgi:hypothetical protein
MSRRTITAHFTDPDEYLEEVLRDLGLIERKIVRVTKVATPGGPNGVLTNVRVESGYISEGRVTRLVVFCGQLWGHTSDDEVQERATQVVDKLEAKLGEWGVDVRAGVWEDE